MILIWGFIHYLFLCIIYHKSLICSTLLCCHFVWYLQSPDSCPTWGLHEGSNLNPGKTSRPLMTHFLQHQQINFNLNLSFFIHVPNISTAFDCWYSPTAVHSFFLMTLIAINLLQNFNPLWKQISNLTKLIFSSWASFQAPPPPQVFDASHWKNGSIFSNHPAGEKIRSCSSQITWNALSWNQTSSTSSHHHFVCSRLCSARPAASYNRMSWGKER